MYPFVLLRQQRLRENIEFGKDRCLEIGALNSPVLKPEDGNVFYVDRLSLAGLKKQFAWDKSFGDDQLIPVDYVWERGKTLKSCVKGSFDYVIASHVAEHVPDLIGWIEEIRQVLKPKGQLRLVFPDGRYSFDMKRQPTRLSDLLAAWMKKAKCPETHLVLDFALNKVDENQLTRIPVKNQSEKDVESFASQFPFSEVLKWGDRSLDPNHYEDVHCWVLHLNLFARLMSILATHDLVRMACVKWFDIDPSRNSYEFMVFLSPEQDRNQCISSWQNVYEQTRVVPYWKDQMQRIQQENTVLKQKISALYQSHSWRLMAPVRAIMRMLQK